MEASVSHPHPKRVAPAFQAAVPATRIITALWLIMTVILLAGLTGQVIKVTTGHQWMFGLIPKTNLYGEGNLPAYFSTMLLATAGLLLVVVAVWHGRARDGSGRQWAALATLFFLLSMDEAAAFHELATEPVHAALNTGGIFFYGWLVPGFVFFALFVVSFWRFFWRLPVETRKRFALAGAVFVLGALGFELVESAVADHHGEAGLDYVVLVVVEEGLEMAGVILFISALFRHIASNLPNITVSFRGK